MSDAIYSDDFEYWTKASLGLKITKEGLYEFVKHEVQTLVAPFSGDDVHFVKFLRSITSEDRIKVERTKMKGQKFKWTFEPNCGSNPCALCTGMFEAILENHTRKNKNDINWKCHDKHLILYSSNNWWIVAKIFIPAGNKYANKSMGPEEVDVQAVFKLMNNCKLFKDILPSVLEVMETRNRLMHSASTEVTKEAMKDSFDNMKALLSEEEVKETSKDKLSELKKLEKERLFLTKTTPDVRFIITEALKLKQRALEYDIKENQKAGWSVENLKKFLDKTKDDLQANRSNDVPEATADHQGNVLYQS